MRTWKRHAGSGVILVLAAACGGRPEPASAQFDAAAEFAKVAAVHARFASARDRLERAQSQASSHSGPPGEVALVREAAAAYDTAFARDQLVLAAFLNQALNLAPERPETREALALYAEAAVANARFLLDRGGDAGRALEPLAAAERAYNALGVPVPARLAAAAEEARRHPAPAATPTPAPRSSRRHRR